MAEQTIEIPVSLDELDDGISRVAMDINASTNNVPMAVRNQQSGGLGADVNIGVSVTTIKSMTVTMPNDGANYYIIAYANVVATFNNVGAGSLVRGTLSFTDGTSTGGFAHQIYYNPTANPASENTVFEPYMILGPYTATGQVITVTLQGTGGTLIIRVSGSTSETGALTITTTMFTMLFSGF